MKMKFFMCAITGVALGTALISCHSNSEAKVEHAEEKVADAKQDLAQAKEEQIKQYNDFKAEMEAQIDENDRKIEELKSNTSKQTPATKEAYKNRIQELKDRNDALRKRIQEHNAEERKEDWESFKREFKHDMDELGASIKDIGKDNVK